MEKIFSSLRLLLLLLACSLYHGYASADTICQNQEAPSEIPSGNVVTFVEPESEGCTGPHWTKGPRYTIEAPQNGLSVCAVGPLPPELIVTNVEADYATCHTFLKYTIDTPQVGMTVCAAEHVSVPSGYAVTQVEPGELAGSTCHTFPKYTINTLQGGMKICAAGGVPPGYVVEEAYFPDATSTCHNWLTYTINPPRNGMKICATGDTGGVPSGYVVEQAQFDSTVCNASMRYTINAPQDGMKVCAAADVPPGYVVSHVQYDTAGTTICSKEFVINTISIPQNGMKICSNGPVSAGYVVTYVEHDLPACGNYNNIPREDGTILDTNYLSYTIETPLDGMAMCAVSAVPEGFNVSYVQQNTVQCKEFDRQTISANVESPPVTPAPPVSPVPPSRGSMPDFNADLDGDGLNLADENKYGTDPMNPDTDGDGVNDGNEVEYQIDPLNPDTDGDGMNDGDEINLGNQGRNPLYNESQGYGICPGQFSKCLPPTKWRQGIPNAPDLPVMHP